MLLIPLSYYNISGDLMVVKVAMEILAGIILLDSEFDTNTMFIITRSNFFSSDRNGLTIVLLNDTTCSHIFLTNRSWHSTIARLFKRKALNSMPSEN
jgi:hypothetical protein